MANPTVKAVITADDQASKVLAAVAINARKAEGVVNRAATVMGRDMAAVQRAMIAAQNQQAAAIERSNVGLNQMRDHLRAIAGMGAVKVAFDGLKEGANLNDALNRARNAGMSKTEADTLYSQSAHIAADVPNLLRSEIVKTGAELRAALLDPSEMASLLSTLAKAQAALKMTGHGEASEQMMQFVKGAEQLNLTKNGEIFTNATSNFVKATQFFQGLLTPETWRKSVAAAGIAGAGWSPHFRDFVFSSLTAEQGERAGTGLNAINKLLTSGFTGNKAALKQFLALGLVDPNDVDEQKGQIALKAGRHIKDVDRAISDPDQWIREDLLPALHKAGIESNEATIAVVRRLFPNGTAAGEIMKFIGQQGLLAKDEAGIRGAAGLDPNRESALNALAALQTAVANFGGTLTSPAMGAAASTMNSIASTMSRFGAGLDDFNKAHTGAGKFFATQSVVLGGAAAVGAFKAALSTIGAPLNASAERLDIAATALERAAAALGRSAEHAASSGPGGGPVKPGKKPSWSSRGLSALFGPEAFGTELFADWLHDTDEKGNLGGLTDGIDNWFQRHRGFNPSDMTFSDVPKIFFGDQDPRGRDGNRGRGQVPPKPEQHYDALNPWGDDHGSLIGRRNDDMRGGDDRHERVKPDPIVIPPVTVSGAVEIDQTVHHTFDFSSLSAYVHTLVSKFSANVSSLGPTMSGSNSPKNPTPGFMGP